MILEEFAFYECREDLQNTDTELIRALTPALLSTRGPLIMISSAFLAEGKFYKSCTSNCGDAGGDRALVIRGASHELNPTLIDDEEIAQAYRDDPISARSEYGSQWRDARSNFLDRAQTMELVENITYRARNHTPFTSPRSICPQVSAQTAPLAPSAITISCAIRRSSTQSLKFGRRRAFVQSGFYEVPG